jgi:hypothetical protein
VLTSNLGMSRYFVKTSVVTLVSFVLLYYGVAWAVLRCAHDADYSDHGIAQYANVNKNDFHQLARRDVHADFGCFGRDYHKESMAGSSSGSRQQRLTPTIDSNVTDFLTLRTVAGDRTIDLAPGIIFERLSSPFFLGGLPVYLSLSILRI